MQRLRKGREVEWQRDVREVQRDISLIKLVCPFFLTFLNLTSKRGAVYGY